MSYSRYAVFDPKSKGSVGASIATLALATGLRPTIAAIRGVGEAIHEFGTDVHYVGLRMRLGFKPDDYRL